MQKTGVFKKIKVTNLNVGLFMGVLLLGGLNISSVHAELSATECVDLMQNAVDNNDWDIWCYEVNKSDMCVDLSQFAYDFSLYFLTEEDIKNFSASGYGDLSDMCELCSAGYYFNESTRNCSPCPKGYIRPGANLAKECKQCQEGSTTDGTGQSECECRPGWGYKDGNCAECEVGYYKNWVGNDYCVQCPGSPSGVTVTATTSGTGATSVSSCRIVGPSVLWADDTGDYRCAGDAVWLVD